MTVTNCLWLYLFLYSVKIRDCRVITFPRCDKAAHSFQFVYASDEKEPHDIFAIGKQATCGLRAGSVVGNGSFSNPYTLAVDLVQGLVNQKPDCGIKDVGDNLYELRIQTTFSGQGATSNDTTHTVKCNLELPLKRFGMPRESNYVCQAPNTIFFTYSQNSTAPFDIYAVGKKGTCSKSAGIGRGSGSSGDPYSLIIGVRHMAQDCDGDSYEVVFLVQQSYPFITASDVTYKLTCNYSNMAIQTMTSTEFKVDGLPLQASVKKISPVASLLLTLPAGKAVSAISVGDDVRLKAHLTTEGTASGLRVSNCLVMPSPGTHPVVKLTHSDGCVGEDALISPFIGIPPGGYVAQTDVFQAFMFAEHHTLMFQCDVWFCFKDNDTKCVGSHCSPSRQKREAVQESYGVISTIVTVRTIDTIKNKQTGSPQQSCRTWSPEVLAVVTSLGILLVMSLAASLLLCVIIRRQGE